METGVGGIINRFKVKSRRNVMFFEEILADYIKLCEDSGHENDIMKIGMEYGYLGVKCFVPKILRSYSSMTILNLVAKKVWRNLGFVKYLRIVKSKDEIRVKTEDEFITRIIGRNKFMPGFMIGVISGFSSNDMEIVRITQNKEKSFYIFQVIDKKMMLVRHKSKEKYNTLNKFPETKGIDLKHVLGRKMFRIKKNNRIYFRDMPMVILENSLFHIIDKRNILMNKIPGISYKVFHKTLGNTKDLFLLKNLIQISGWGNVKIIDSENEITVEISNQPYGIQREKDNWGFLVQMILGYLWLIRKDFKIGTIDQKGKTLKVIYRK